MARLLSVARAARLEVAVWLVAMALFIAATFVMTALMHAGPIPPGAAEDARAFRADYLSPWRIVQAVLLAPLIETWLIVKGVDALQALQWRGSKMFGLVALVAAVMHYFARGSASALYNAAFFALMARIYANHAFENEKRGENRPASILLILLMHMANNAVALGMIWVYSTPP
ncbi:MAG: hypothetical protein LCH39_13905 [Proteobacteria bacterium]|nr:hypothetical protein [Pseudomonadota bacterium]